MEDMETKINAEVAMRHYANLRKAQHAYNERQRQAKKDAGTYRGRGRPRKNPEVVKVE